MPTAGEHRKYGDSHRQRQLREPRPTKRNVADFRPVIRPVSMKGAGHDT